MLKASALYIVIIIALVIAVLCSSLIVAAYFYKTQYQRKTRYDQLDNNLTSGINILIAGTDTSYSHGKTFSLFNDDADSVALKRFFWGMYDIGTVQSFSQKDTLFKTFSMANMIDSSKWAALYLADDDSPLSLSGKTMIKGDAYLPKAGITEAYIDNKGYEGDKKLVTGHKYTSERILPPLKKERLAIFENLMSQKHPGDTSINKDSIKNSFLSETRFIDLGKKINTLKNTYINGNIIIVSDTALFIDSSAILKNIMIFAKSITVKKGFHGSCQLFATDSINIRQNCKFNYPSCLGVLSYNSTNIGVPPQIKIDSNSNFTGIIFTYEKNKSAIGATVEIGKNIIISGQIYSQSNLKFTDSSVINGSIFTSALLYKKDFKFYRGYLIDARINSKALSPYYLTGELLPVASKKKKVLQWLEAN